VLHCDSKMKQKRELLFLGIILVSTLIVIQLFHDDVNEKQDLKYNSFLEYLSTHPNVAEKLYPYMYYNEKTDYPTYLHWFYSNIN